MQVAESATAAGGSPAYAGIDPCICAVCGRCGRFPRIRGDRPCIASPNRRR